MRVTEDLDVSKTQKRGFSLSIRLIQVSTMQKYVFIGLAVFFCAMDAHYAYIESNPSDSAPPYVLIILFVLFCLHGWFSPWSDIAYVIFVDFVTLVSPLSDNLGFAMIATSAIAISWLAENWVWQGILIYFSTRICLYINHSNTQFVLFDTAMQLAIVLVFGLFLRWQRNRAEKFHSDLKAARKSVENVKAQLRRELATQLHDTIAKDLAQISLDAQKLRDDPSSVTPEALAELAREASAAARRIRPMILNLDINRESISLDKALEESRKMLTTRGITLEIITPPGLHTSLTRQQQIVSSLVVRESASNILKYAPENSFASMELTVDEERNLSIYTQNRVAEHPDASITGGFGLRNLEDKISSECGELLFGKSGDMWTLSAEIPYRKGVTP
ncbi:histidine kinase [Mobiluncus mulieris]|uniref:histidine kinase n=1 Tax=Mobiluncus mulieris TaxID=2052 RepID=UPI0020163930|nr:histidine kinase [Mobiluncus mulieris]